VPERFHLAGPGETTTRAFPLALSQGVQTTGMYFNKAMLDRARLEAPRTIADLKAMVKPLAALGAAPLTFCSGEISFNSLLVTWLLPMIAGRAGDPVAFVERTIKGQVGYDSPEWIEAFETIADLRTSGVLLEGSGATDYATMQALVLQGKAALAYNGSWLLTQLQAGTPSVAFDLHVAPLPLVDGTSKAHSILSWAGVAMPRRRTMLMAPRTRVPRSSPCRSPSAFAVSVQPPRVSVKSGVVPVMKVWITTRIATVEKGAARRRATSFAGMRSMAMVPRHRTKTPSGRMGRAAVTTAMIAASATRRFTRGSIRVRALSR